MNDYDDFFSHYDKPVITNLEPVEPFVNHRSLFVKIIVIYIVVTLAISGFMFAYGGYRFPDPQALLDKINESVPLTMSVELTNDDPIYPYDVTINGSISNENVEIIPSIYVEIEFFDEFDQSIGITTVSKEYVGYLETWIIDETFFTDTEPAYFSYSIGIDEASIFYVSINFLQVFITGIIFVYIGLNGFKKDYQDFKKSIGNHVGQIIVGVIMVYAAMLISQLILSFFGATGTSQNEMTIQSMFSSDPSALLLLFLTLVIFTPIVEEMVFRRAIYGLAESKWGSTAAIIISGSIFGLMHVIAFSDFIQSIPYIGMGLVFGYVYYRSNKNIYVTMGVHLINNLIAYLSYLVYFLMII